MIVSLNQFHFIYKNKLWSVVYPKQTINNLAKYVKIYFLKPLSHQTAMSQRFYSFLNLSARCGVAAKYVKNIKFARNSVFTTFLQRT